MLRVFAVQVIVSALHLADAQSSGSRALLQAAAAATSGGATAVASVKELTTNATASQARKDTNLASPDYSGVGYNFTRANSTANPNADAASASAFAAAAVNGAGTWNVVGQSGAIAIHAILTANNHALLMMRPDPTYPDDSLAVDGGNEIAAIYDVAANTYVPFHIVEHPFCAGHLVLPNGHVLIAGGDNVDLNPPFLTNGLQSVRDYNPDEPSYTLPETLPTGRWYPTLVTLPDGHILIAGGSQVEAGGYAAGCSNNLPGSPADPTYDNPTYTIYDPASGTLSGDVPLPILADAWPINLYPYLTVLPQSGSVLTIAGREVQALMFTAEGATPDAAYGNFPALPIPISYPQTASVVMLTLEPPDYHVQILIVGGTSADCADMNTPASTTSMLIDATAGADHTPVTETMPVARVMPDAVLLPTGDVFVCNGAQTGVAGGAPGTGQANNAATAASLYTATAPVGSRWSTLADSLIARLYHSSAFLTSNAEVWVSGSEPTVDYRVQTFTPSYIEPGNARPVVGSAPSNLAYGAVFEIDFTGTDAIDRVVIDKLTGVTHSTHMDQRQVRLACNDLVAGASITCTAPPDATIAPAGHYQLFILYEGVPSASQMVIVG
ncbi:hypothetical protein WJX74_008758 [Apatococcus lobatus]|uniref:Galactose oxidase n=1 Tax=Apatococcus lobatus TaxID=904363 RepID=A0AAW1RGG0_9CHLO